MKMIKTTVRQYSDAIIENHNCVICQKEFEPDDEVTPLPCNERHYFHTVCIDNWLQDNLKCPICNKETS